MVMVHGLASSFGGGGGGAAAAGGGGWQCVAAQSTCRRIQNYSEDSSGDEKRE